MKGKRKFFAYLAFLIAMCLILVIGGWLNVGISFIVKVVAGVSAGYLGVQWHLDNNNKE